MSEAEYLCDRIVLLHEGKVVDQRSLPELLERSGCANLTGTFCPGATLRWAESSRRLEWLWSHARMATRNRRRNRSRTSRNTVHLDGDPVGQTMSLSRLPGSRGDRPREVRVWPTKVNSLEASWLQPQSFRARYLSSKVKFLRPGIHGTGCVLVASPGANSESDPLGTLRLKWRGAGRKRWRPVIWRPRRHSSTPGATSTRSMTCSQTVPYCSRFSK